ncbi:O-antigen ligase family protein [Patescibacteria group bacterium]|nr:O-antigen ligase family protein [Patescibacteria group bacterium]
MILALVISLLFLFLILLGDNQFGAYVIFIASGLLLLFSSRLLSKKKISIFFSRKELIFLFLLILIFLTISSLSLIYTISLPHSINRLITLIFSFLISFFFLFIKDKYIEKENLLLMFNLLIVSLGLLVLILTIFPGIGEFLPGMNLIFLSYGHNHFAAFLLLILPLFYWQLLSRKSGFHLFIFIFSYFLILISFARVVILLAVVEFLLLLFVSKESFQSLKASSKKIITITITFLSFFLLLMAIFSFSNLFKLNSVCNSDLKVICKDISNEGRKIYWTNSILIFKENIVNGTGLNTYSLENQKYIHYGDTATSYPHNEFLQMFSDLGIVGGFSFLTLMYYLLYLSFKIIKKTEKKSINRFLFVGLIFTYLNSFFDFDWQFVSIYSLTLIFFSLILRQALKDDLLSKNKVNFNYLFSSFYYFLNIPLFLVTLLIVSSNLLVFFGKDDLAFRVYPYSFYQKFVFLKSELLSGNDRKKLENIYGNDPFFLIQSSMSKTFEEKLNSYTKAFEKYPLSISTKDFSLFIENECLNEDNYIKSKELLFRMVNFIVEEQNKGFPVSDDIKNDVGNYLVSLGNIAYKERNLIYLGEIYYEYSRIFIQFPKGYNPLFLSDEVELAHASFLFSMGEFNPFLFRDQTEKFIEFYRNTAEELLVYGRSEEAYELYSRMLPIFRREGIWFGDISDFVLKETSSKVKKKNADLDLYLSNFMNFYFQNEDLYWNYFFKKELSFDLINLANAVYLENEPLALKYYSFAHVLDEWSLLDNGINI